MWNTDRQYTILHFDLPGGIGVTRWPWVEKLIYDEIIFNYLPVVNILLDAATGVLPGGLKICLCPCLMARFSHPSFNDGLIRYAVEIEEEARQREREYRSSGCFAEAVSMINLAQVCRQARYDCQVRFGGLLSGSITGLAAAGYSIAACTTARLDALPSPEAIASQLGFARESFRQNLGWVPEEIVLCSDHENSGAFHEAARFWGFNSVETDTRPAGEGVDCLKRLLGRVDSKPFGGYYPYPLPFHGKEIEPSNPMVGNRSDPASPGNHTNHLSVLGRDYAVNLPAEIAIMIKEGSFNRKSAGASVLPPFFKSEDRAANGREPHWTSRRIAELDLQFQRLLHDHSSPIPEEIVRYCAGELFFLETVDWNLLSSRSKETIAFSKEFFERFSILNFIIQLVKQTPSAVVFFNKKLYAGNRQEYWLDMVNAGPWQSRERLAL